MGRTRGGLDNDTLLRMGEFYDLQYHQKIEELLELTIQFHADRSYRNFLKVQNCLNYCREDMVRRQAYLAHAEPEKNSDRIENSFEDTRHQS